MAQMSRTFVLVHGTWHGGWLWRDVASRLRSEGHVVFTPTCTGCGEREHLSAPDVGLDTHIEDVMAVIETEELEDVVLAAHSFAGVTITGVADRMRSKMRRLVFLDALVPREGRMAGVPRDPETGELPDKFKERQKSFIDGYKMEFWASYPMKMILPDDAVEQIARAKRLITTHPMRQWTDELVLQNGGWQGLDPAYVHFVGQQYALTSEEMVGPARGPEWDFSELDIPRNGMMTHPDLVAEKLMALAD